MKNFMRFVSVLCKYHKATARCKMKVTVLVQGYSENGLLFSLFLECVVN